MSRDVFLTIGVTAHAEGIIAHKTIMSIFKALENLDVKKYPYEIIVHIDNGDVETENYFKRYENDKRFKIIRSKFGDLGKSRNCIAQNARGKYISFLDADDMLSSNWYVNAIKRMQESKETIMVHPMIQLNFGAGTRPEFTVRSDSFSKFEDAIISAGVNRWCSAIMGERKTFLEYPYMETKNGYGYEDYNLNTNTVGHGIKHMVVPETVMFYRQKASGSLLASSNTEHVIQPYVSLLDIEYLKSVPQSEMDAMQARTLASRRQNRIVGIYYKIRKNEQINYFIIPVAKLTKKILGIGVPAKRNSAKIPRFMLDEWKKISVIEPQLYPTKQILAEIFQAKADDYDVGLAYYDLVKEIPKLPDYIFVVPWLRVGGADKVLINYIKAIEYHHPEATVAVITTVPGDNTKVQDLPKNAYLIDFGNRTYSMWPPMREMVFSRLITQLRCKKMHIINSEFGYSWVATHKKFAKSEIEVDVSIFSTLNKYTLGTGGTYASPYLMDIYDVVKNIYTDNKRMVLDLESIEGMDCSKMKVIYQPIDVMKKQGMIRDGQKYKILWASRVDHEKIPEILPKIAKELDNNKYQIVMYGEFGEDYKKANFVGKNGISYKGKFTKFEQIKPWEYDVFLYTSVRDGMPNIVLEAMSAGIPVVASNIGGVGEIIRNNETGILVDDILNPKEYAAGIKKIYSNKTSAKKYVDAGLKLIEKEHSWKKFYKKMREMF